MQSSLAVLGEISISGTMIKAENLADTLQVCLDSGAKKVLLPQLSAVDLGTVPLVCRLNHFCNYTCQIVVICPVLLSEAYRVVRRSKKNPDRWLQDGADNSNYD